MIGKSLRERYELGALAAERTIALVTEMLPSQAKLLVEVRARDASMVACLIVRADQASVRLCRSLGFRMKLGGTGVFGLLGADALRLLRDATPDQRAWLEAGCAPRETKVLVVSGGIGLVSLEANEGKVVVTAGP